MKNLFLIFTLLSFLSCKKDEPVQIRVHLTSTPGGYSQVNIDLQEVRVKSDKGPWQTLETYEGIYNLLTLINDADTLIATGPFPEGRIQQIRLVLGENNSLVLTSGENYPLSIPSGSDGLNVTLSQKAEDNATIIIDFNADLSVDKINDSTFHLKPALKIK